LGSHQRRTCEGFDEAKEMDVRNARRVLLGMVLVLGGVEVPMARACLNDTRTSAAEAEFRSRYDTTPPTAPTLGPTIWGVDAWGAAATVVGAGSVAGGIILASRRKGR
jgi:hypothetical protein